MKEDLTFLIAFIAVSVYVMGLVLHTAIAKSAKKPTLREVFYILAPVVVIMFVSASFREAFAPVRRAVSFIVYGNHPPVEGDALPFYAWPFFAALLLALTFSVWKFPSVRKFSLDSLEAWFGSKPQLFTCQYGTITYHVLDSRQLKKAGGIQKIADILRINSAPISAKQQEALGIKIVHFQPSASSDPEKPPEMFI